MLDLFQAEIGKDDLYNQLKRDNVSWHKIVRAHLNKCFNFYEQYLDRNFVTQTPTEFFSCLWELKLVNYLGALKKGTLEQILKGYISLPDFKFNINGKSYYIEATCPKKGSAEKLYYNTMDNDFLLIHNPFATIPLPPGSFPVAREMIAKHHNGSFTIEPINLFWAA